MTNVPKELRTQFLLVLCVTNVFSQATTSCVKDCSKSLVNHHSNLILSPFVACHQPNAKPHQTKLPRWRLQNAEAESLMRRAREKERQGAEQDSRRESDGCGEPD